jgi:S-methylmethionine-dependent homocysteine/selenocysteine methylase
VNEIPTVPLADGVVLLDGGMGRELRRRGVEIPGTIWSAGALIAAPEVVRQVHADYIAAGADVITTNSYGVIRADLAKEGLEDRFAELNGLACALAAEARAAAGREVLIAGSLPPLRGSFRPDLVGPDEEIKPLYREQAELLAPHVDLLICETMSSAAEGLAAATAACATGLPVWVAWTLHEDHSGRLRSGENVGKAAAIIEDLPVSALLVNCSAPESVSAAMPELAAFGPLPAGGYANAFAPVPEDWTLNGEREVDGMIGLRGDLDPEAYLAFAREWRAAGARIIGGCCGIGPAHIARLRQDLA